MITIQDLGKVFKAKDSEVVALHDLNLQVEPGEFFVLLGPSGSGKTTLLRCVAGLEKADQGEMYLAGRCVFSSARRILVPAEDRKVGMVFQSYAIWPHLTVFQNVALPLRHGKGKIPKAMITDRVRRALALVGLEEMESRPSPLLSGGQQQRVALARALAIEPSILLMDEPLSNLDARLREEVRAEIKALVERLGVTVLYVTHDQAEAMDLADRVAVMHHGGVLQLGAPEDLYMFPAHSEVAQFLGSTNWLQGEMGADEVVQTSVGKLHTKADGRFGPHDSVTLAIRPESIELLADAPEGDLAENSFSGEIISARFLGDHRLYTIRVNDATLLVRTAQSQKLTGQVHVRIARTDIRLFPKDAAGQTANS